MAYIYSTPLQKSDRTDRGIRRIYGMNKKTVRRILYMIQKAPRSRVLEVRGEEVSKVTTYLRSRGEFDSFARLQMKEDILRLQRINSYRGLRHTAQLPVRGQRTHTNAKTIRYFIHGKKTKRMNYNIQWSGEKKKKGLQKKSQKKK